MAHEARRCLELLVSELRAMSSEPDLLVYGKKAEAVGLAAQLVRSLAETVNNVHSLDLLTVYAIGTTQKTASRCLYAELPAPLPGGPAKDIFRTFAG